MSSIRATEEWTEKLEDAFIDNTKALKGRAGELLVIEAFTNWGYSVKDNESDMEAQKEGKDILIKKESWSRYYSIDVKANMNKDGVFYVDTSNKGWLFNSQKKSNRICHACVETRWIAWYDRQLMQTYCIQNDDGKDYMMISPKNNLEFITWRKVV